MRRLLLAPALGLLLVPARAADLPVGPSGSGAAYTSIQAAIDAAQPGDRVLVLPGEYNGAVFVNKPIELLGSGSTSTRIRSIATTFPGVVSPALVVADIAAGQRARVAGFETLIGGVLIFPIPYVVGVRDSAGRIELSDILIPQGPVPPYPQGSATGFLSITNSAQVVATAVRNTASSTVFFPVSGGGSATDGLSGALVVNSSVWFGDCAFAGAARAGVVSGLGGNGGHGILAVGSAIQLGRTVSRGGQSGGLAAGVPGAGGAGIFATDSDLLVHGGSGNLIEGADAVEMALFGPALGAAGSAIVLDGTSSLVHASDVVLSPGSPSAAFPGGLPVDAAPGASVTALSERRPTLSISPVVAPLGSALAIGLEGEPGTVHLRALSIATGPAIAIPGISGSLLLDLGVLLVMPAIVLDPSGVASLVSGIPADPSLAGASIVEQAAQIGPSGVSLGPPALLAIGF